MVANDKLKCFVGTAKNGAKYRACLPKNKPKPYKKHQDLRGKPHSSATRKQPRQLAYPDRASAASEKAHRGEREKGAGVDSKRASIMRRWQKKIDKETTKEGKSKMSTRRNKVLAKYEKDKTKTHKMPSGDIHTGKKHTADSKVVKKAAPKKKGLKVLTKEEADAKRKRRGAPKKLKIKGYKIGERKKEPNYKGYKIVDKK